MAVSSTARGGCCKFAFAAATTAGMPFMRAMAFATFVSFGSRDWARIRNTLSLMYSL